MISSENNEKMGNLTLYHKLIDLYQLRNYSPPEHHFAHSLLSFQSIRDESDSHDRVCFMESL